MYKICPYTSTYFLKLLVVLYLGINAKFQLKLEPITYTITMKKVNLIKC